MLSSLEIVRRNIAQYHCAIFDHLGVALYSLSFFNSQTFKKIKIEKIEPISKLIYVGRAGRTSASLDRVGREMANVTAREGRQSDSRGARYPGETDFPDEAQSR